MLSHYSGKFVLRVPKGTHQTLAKEAEKRSLSLNSLCLQLLDLGFKAKENTAHPYPHIIKNLQKKFGENLLGILLFGSQVTGNSTANSDVDFLIVLSDEIPLTRSLYSWWDETVSQTGKTLNPQFVHLPQIPSEAGGLWFEISLAHQLLWEKRNHVSKFLEQLQGLMAADRVRRYWSNGHPYWVWRNQHEEHITGE